MRDFVPILRGCHIYSTDQKKVSILLYRTWCEVRHTITVLSTTRSKLPCKCSSNATIVLLSHFECYVRNIGHDREF